MNLKECMAALEGAGSEQTRKTYSRHGAAEPMFGVSFAFLGQLTKKVGTNHELALQLWETGNHDARVFAEMIMDPAQLPQKTLEAWAKTQSGRFACGQFAGLVAKTPHAKKLSAKWRGMKDEWMSMMGWSIVGGLACTKYHCGRPAAGVPGLADADDPGAVTEDELSAFVDEIEAGIANAPNMTKYAMNGALISIGTVSDALFKKAMAAAKRIGTVDVDHGNTSCKTPFAPTYLPKAREATKKRVEKASAKKAGKKSAKKTAKKAAKKTAKKASKKTSKK